MKTGIELIAEERERQIHVEKFDVIHDEGYSSMELSGAAGCYIANAMNKWWYENTHTDRKNNARFQIYSEAETDLMAGNTGDRGDRQLRPAKWNDAWPWDEVWDKRKKHSALRSLVIAGALIAAEIDRLQSESDEKR